MKVTILIPAHNEAERISETLAGLCTMLEQIDPLDNPTCGIWVIDDHSTDQTGAVVRGFIDALSLPSQEQSSHRSCSQDRYTAQIPHNDRPYSKGRNTPLITLISLDDQNAETNPQSKHINQCHSQPRGKGQALNYALKALPSDTVSDVYLIVDADLGRSAGELAALVREVAHNHVDMAIGAFKQRSTQAGGFGFVKRKALNGIQRLSGKPVSFLSPLSGQRAFSPQAFFKLTPFEDGFGVEIALTIKALWLNLTVTEVPLNLSHRYTTNDLAGIFHRLKQYVDVARTLSRLKRTHNTFMEAADKEPFLPNRTPRQ